MERLARAAQTTPIIDHHAHNLLIPSATNVHDILSITSEAHGPALQDAKSTIAHLRAVKQLSTVLNCGSSWSEVLKATEQERQKPNDAWARRCFEGIETVLIDDGLDPSEVHPYQWHDRLTRSKCRRILRVEKVAEYLINQAISDYRKSASDVRKRFPERIAERFNAVISDALASDEIAGFKSVICYRTGLNIPTCVHNFEEAMTSILSDDKIKSYTRLQNSILNPFFVHLTARLIDRSKKPKPFQFHTGLGDNDINLRLSNPSHLQPFIELYSKVPIVLLHAAYPFTADAGYLTSVFKNGKTLKGALFAAFTDMHSLSGYRRSVSNGQSGCARKGHT